MSKLLITVVLTSFVTILSASPAAACINDRLTRKTEYEFKKNYEFKSGYQEKDPAPELSPPAEKSWGPLAAMGSGVACLVAAAGLVVVNFRRSGRA
jgi:hypothetical protein